MQSIVNIMSKEQFSALLLCCRRFDDEGVKVARVLLDAGADIELSYLRNNFLTACGYGRPELVSLLLERGANAKVVDKDGSTAFHIACANKAFGRDIIPLVAHAEVDICSATSRGAILLKWQRLPKSRER
jgi:hypothetical protein